MRSFIYLISILFLSACINKKDVPKNIIQPEKMQKIMMEMFTADGVNNELSLRDTSFNLPDNNKSKFQQIFTNHKISKDQFYKSYNFYLGHPDLLKPITDSLAAISNKQSLKLNTDTTQKLLNGNNIKDTARQAGNR